MNKELRCLKMKIMLRKLDAFEMNQLLIGRDVLLLHESSSAPLNTRVLDCYIQEYLV